MSCNFQVKHFACEKVISNLLTKKTTVYKIVFGGKSYLKVMIKAELHHCRPTTIVCNIY